VTDVLDRLISLLSDRYRIERELGQGGMATVYLAEDVRHGRRVAVKVVHPDLAAVLGSDRFLTEIRTTASLQHPHILPLYDSGQIEGQLFYVMPYVKGESLRDRLDRERQLPVEEAVRITRQVASALEYAHRQGVVHRDVKPENVLLQEGQALVADFGIALAVSQAGTSRLTQTGLSLGTPSYMSPEQATGERSIDARSDIYSLGVMLYEMLAGQPPFTGANAQAVVAKVLTEKPPAVTASRGSVPRHITLAIDKALAKLPADRFTTAAEFAAAIENPRFTTGAGEVEAATAGSVRNWRRVSIALAGVSALLVVAAAWGVSGRRSATALKIYDVGLEDAGPIAFSGTSLTIAPNGAFVIYSGGEESARPRLWYRSLMDATTRPIEGTEGGLEPRISPDGRLVAFLDYPRLKVMPVAGGTTRVVAEVRDPVSIEWGSPTRLYIDDDDGGTFRWIDAELGQTSSARIPYCVDGRWLPTTEEVLCGGGGRKYAMIANPKTSRYRVVNTATADREAGFDIIAGSDFRVVDDKYVVFMSVEGDIAAAKFDARAARIGRPVRLVQGVRREAYRGTGQFDIADNGTLVYALGANAEIGPIVRASAGSQPQPLPVPPGAFLRYRLSPDERRLAAVVQASGNQELRIYDLRDGRSQVWLSHQSIAEPVWSPRGDRIATALLTDRGERTRAETRVIVGSPDATSQPDTIFSGDDAFEPMSWPNDSLIIAQDWNGSIVLGVNPGTRPVRVDSLVRDAVFPSLSPGGRLLAYSSTKSAEVVLTPYPSRDRRVVVTRDGGEPQWLSAGRLNFRSGLSWMEVDVNPVTGEVTGPPRRWFTDPRFSDTPGWSQHLTRNGELIYVQGPVRTGASYLRVVPNWVAAMKRAVDEAQAGGSGSK
jgi:serine/threonine-protein kinase